MDATEADEINRQYRILIAGFAFHFRASRIDILDKSRATRQAGQTVGHQLAAQILFRLPLARSINDRQEQASDSVRKVGQPSQAAVQKLRRSEEHTSELQSLMRNSYVVFCLTNIKMTININLTHI